jgi:HSP20 family protein
MSSSTSASDKSKNNTNRDKMESKKNNKSTEEERGDSGIAPITNYYNDFFENFRQNMQNIMEETWPNSVFPTKTFSPFDLFDRMTDTRIPLCDVMDKGDRYEIALEIPGIDKDKIDVKATKNSVTISGKQSEKTKEKGKNYIYSERSYKSFHRQIPFPQEIVPSKITAKVNNGVLEVDLPKKQPRIAEGKEEYKVNVA